MVFALLQGVFIKRHKVLKEDGNPFSPADFVIGETVAMYGRRIYLVDCDDFTREYLTNKMSMNVGGPIAYPTEPIHVYQAAYQKKDTGEDTRFLSSPNIAIGQSCSPFVNKIFRI